MSTQRRRVLANAEACIPIDKISDGVYIEDIDGKAYKADDWRSDYTANSIAVASGDVKFRMALKQSLMPISDSLSEPLEKYMTGATSSEKALLDYNGARNTANMLLAQPSTSYAAGYCNTFVFPDSKTKGFLPSLGQLNLAYQNKAAVDTAISKCGGTPMSADWYYWSSTFMENRNGYRICWMLDWEENYYIGGSYLTYDHWARPFANIS